MVGEKDKIELVVPKPEDSVVKEPEPKPTEVKEPEKKVETPSVPAESFVSPGVSGPTKSVLDKIASIFKSSKKAPEPQPEAVTEVVESDKGGAEQETSELKEDEKPEYEEIDPRFVEAASNYGWNDQRITDYAESHSDEDILTMVNLMEGISKKVQPTPEVKEQSQDELFNEETLSKYAEAFNVDKETLKGIAKTMTGPLADHLNRVSSELEVIKGGLSAKEADKELEKVAHNTEVANAIFDKSKISSLGETKNILKYPDGSYVTNDPIFQERSKVWDVAQMFHAKGGTFEMAVENALQWYKGSGAEKDIKRNVIKNLKEQEERVMPKRQGQNETVVYGSEEERKAALINAAVAKYGKEFA